MQYTKLIWRDQQPYSEMFDDIYYSSEAGETVSGESEFEHVFFRQNGLPERWIERFSDRGEENSTAKYQFVIAELGFGSGLNCILTIKKWLEFIADCDDADTCQHACLHYIAIEKHPLSPQTLTELISRYPELKDIADELIKNYPPAVDTTHLRRLFTGRVVIHYKFMDALQALSDSDLKVDAWYLDGFSPAKNPQMWSEALFQRIADNSLADTTCSTYTAAGFVKRNMQAAGFTVNKVAGHGRKREMLTAVMETKQAPVCLKFKDKPWFAAAPATSGGDGSAGSEQKTSQHKTAAIIGAGIAGLSVAYALVQRGWKVSIIDKQGAVACGTSANPAAIVYPRVSANNDVDTAFYVEAYVYSLYLLKKLQNKHTEKFWFDSGMLQRFDSERITKIIERYDFDDEFLSVLDVSKKLPLAGESDVYAEYGNTGVVLPPVLAEVLRQECGDDLEIIHAEVIRIQQKTIRQQPIRQQSVEQKDVRQAQKWQCHDGEVMISSTDILIIANGVSVNELDIAKQPLSSFPVESIRGQMVELNTNKSSDAIQQAVNAEVYITPEIAGRHFVGGSYSRDDNNAEIDADDNEALLTSLASAYPDVFTRQDIAGAWVGFRPMSKDRVPMVGAVPDEDFFRQQYADINLGDAKKCYEAARYLDGLYISAAHGSRAFTSCLLSGEIIAADIEGEPSPIERSVQNYLSPSRFIVNDLKRR